MSKKQKKPKKSKEDEAAALAMDKKKMKVIKDALKDLRLKFQLLEQENKTLKEKNDTMSRDLVDTKRRSTELFDQNS